MDKRASAPHSTPLVQVRQLTAVNNKIDSCQLSNELRRAICAVIVTDRASKRKDVVTIRNINRLSVVVLRESREKKTWDRGKLLEKHKQIIWCGRSRLAVLTGATRPRSPL